MTYQFNKAPAEISEDGLSVTMILNIDRIIYEFARHSPRHNGSRFYTVTEEIEYIFRKLLVPRIRQKWRVPRRIQALYEVAAFAPLHDTDPKQDIVMGFSDCGTRVRMVIDIDRIIYEYAQCPKRIHPDLQYMTDMEVEMIVNGLSSQIKRTWNVPAEIQKLYEQEEKSGRSTVDEYDDGVPF